MFNDANICEIISNYVKITDNGNRFENYLGDMLIKPFNLGDSYFIEISWHTSLAQENIPSI